MSRHVQAAGGVLWRRVDGEVRVAVVHRPRYDDWSLPKGKLEPGELHVVGAVREVAEEAGFTAYAWRTLGQSDYRVLDRGRDAPKTVRWWAMQAVDGAFVPAAEVDALLWLDVPSALRRVTAGRDSAPLLAFAEQPPETTTVLLVRHGSAGQREDWQGDDDERPLDARGRAEALAASSVLEAYGPARVLSAPVQRCVETVRPLAERLGRPVEVDPALSEDLHAKDPGAIVDPLRALSGEPRAVVACSQGGAIPDAVAALAEADGLDPGRVTARKGSVWALTFSHGRLVDADHTPDLVDP
jgi:8-oxo-dGTP diphosphatase